MVGKTEVPLILGGHSFISQLGNDAAASEADQRRIAEACLDQGIAWFDSTYMPERIAVGNALATLGRREEARILAWNFFTPFGPGEPVGGPDYFRPGHIDKILEQLRTSYVDVLVVVPLDNAEKNQRQEELAIEWQRDGYARALGLWIPEPSTVSVPPAAGPFRFAVHPFNNSTPKAARIFALCKACGWETLATSPFHRGWQLDRLIAAAVAKGLGDPQRLRVELADLMLRYVLYQPNVDRVIVAMRKVEWIARNLESVTHGPLVPDEFRRLQEFQSLASRKGPWWRRLRRLF
jgi:aryl-alcohol dehydrogenase-like predicted oxidoreductase